MNHIARPCSTSAFPSEAEHVEERCPSLAGVLGKLPLPAVTTDRIFPWHVAFDRDLNIISLGSSLADRYGSEVANRKVYQIIRILRPTEINGLQFEDYLRCNSTVDFVVKVLKDRKARGAAEKAKYMDDASVLKALDDPMSLYLKGEMTYIEELDAMVFLGIPSITGVDQMENLGILLKDMPIHSNGRELVFGVAAQNATMSEAEALTKEAALLQLNLKQEKRKAEELLHRILPPNIASKLAKGEAAPAETHSAVSILFSDIVGFTKISSSVHPQYVMDMLNELFSKFDKLCEDHGVYKVETIGDAYMVVSGMPEPNAQHADALAGFAVDMVKVAQTVLSPLNQQPLNIRVGIHTGSIMAGVGECLRGVGGVVAVASPLGVVVRHLARPE